MSAGTDSGRQPRRAEPASAHPEAPVSVCDRLHGAELHRRQVASHCLKPHGHTQIDAALEQVIHS